ncbi:MAG: beta-lactamase family protein [Flavobacteriales bacterium]|nr:beta-lactamase family protein [Flavobacteriales bacterium]
MRFFISFFIVLVLFSSCSEHHTGEGATSKQTNSIDSTAYFDSLYAPLREQIDTFFIGKLNRKEFNGSVLIADKGHVVLKKSYGFTSPDEKDSLQLHHRFQLASVSKPFTSAAVLLLADRGKIHLDDSIQVYLDSFPYHGITVRMLLCHRGGLSNYNYFADEYWSDKSKPVSNDSVLMMLYRNQPKPYYRPNEKFDYSNTGYMLLASIVEKVSGESFSSFMKKEIFDPLGMTHSAIYDRCAGVEIQDRLEGYDWKDRKIEDTYQNGVVGDKGMYSTVEDLFLFDRAIHKGKLLKPATWKEAFRSHNPDRGENGKDDYGLGWRLKTSFAGYEVVYHTGWWKGFRSYFIRNITLDQTIILTDNMKRNRFLGIEELLDLADGGSFGSALMSDSLAVEGGNKK